MKKFIALILFFAFSFTSIPLAYADFANGTLVQTETGFKPIEQIRVGDLVQAKDETTGKIEYHRVVQLFQRQADETYHITIKGIPIATTEEHPFWVHGRGWVEARHLQAGDLLQNAEGKSYPIDRIEMKNNSLPVYNFEVEGVHNYFVTESEIWTHNNGGLIKVIAKMLGNAGKNAARNSGKSTAKNAKNVSKGTGKSFVKQVKLPKEFTITNRWPFKKDSNMMNGRGPGEITGKIARKKALEKTPKKTPAKTSAKTNGKSAGKVNKGTGKVKTPTIAGRGHSKGGRHQPINLREQLAMEESMSNPARGKTLEGKNTDPRWPASKGWEKKARNVNGVEVHYQYNPRTGQIDDFKIK